MQFLRKSKSLAEIEEETEHKQAENELKGTELSIEQKKTAIAELKKRGLTPAHFAQNFSRIIQWLRTH